MGTTTVYRIVVRGVLSERYAVAFEELKMEPRHHQTVLTGNVKDQAHLHGILNRIGALGLKLVSVEDLSEHQGDERLNREKHASRKPRE